MKELTLNDIVIGNEYTIKEHHYGFNIGEKVVAIDAHLNDKASHRFRGKDGHTAYVSYDKLEGIPEEIKEGAIVEVVDGSSYIHTITGCIGEIVSHGRFKILARSNYDDAEVGSIFHVNHDCLKVLSPAIEDNVTVTCEGNETVMARAKAKELNLI